MAAQQNVSGAQFFHLTDNPHFSLDPTRVPEDNALSIRSREEPGLYMGKGPHSVETWVNGHGYMRPYVAEIQVPDHLARPERWSGERFLPAEHFNAAQIQRVIPLDAHAREQYGSHGWIEERVGTTFDTDESIKPVGMGSPMSAHYPFKGYKYSGPDVREMSPDDDARHQERARRAQEM